MHITCWVGADLQTTFEWHKKAVTEFDLTSLLAISVHVTKSSIDK